MTFGAWSAGVVLAGVAALALALFALQQLRTRYRDVTVVTTLFWKQVSHEAPVRTLRERFRHPLAYLLILAIATCVWLALGDPQWRSAASGEMYVVIVDGSAGMGRGDRMAAALAEARAIVDGLPRARRSVVWAGATVRPLLAPGEETILLEERTAGRQADAAPPSVGQAIRGAIAARQSDADTRVIVVGDAPVGSEIVAGLPAGMTVTRASRPAGTDPNAGITALGVSDAASGAWDRVDVSLSVEWHAGMPAAPVTVTVDGAAWPDAATERAAWPDGRGTSVRLRDVPASGGLLEARLPGDGLAADDTASLRLPLRRMVRVLVSPSVAPALRPVLEADHGVEIVDTAPDVVIRRAGEAAGVTQPSLEFVDADAQATAFVLTHPAAVDAAEALATAVDRIGLRQIDAMSLAEQAGRPIEVSVATGGAWRFSVWASLLTDEFNFTRSRAFPLFVANAVRWLAQGEAWAPYVAAGRALRMTEGIVPPVVLGPNGRAWDAGGLALVPPSAGSLAREKAEPLAASLLSPAVTRGDGEDSLPVDVSVVPAGGAPPLLTWFALAALVLLAGEWHLYQRGRVP